MKISRIIKNNNKWEYEVYKDPRTVLTNVENVNF